MRRIFSDLGRNFQIKTYFKKTTNNRFKFKYFSKTYSSLPSEGFVVNIIGVVVLIFGSLVSYLVTTSQFERAKSPEETLLLN